MKQKSLLLAIYNAIDDLNLKSDLQFQKAKTICAYIMNLYVYGGHNYSDYLSLAHEYFESILPSKRDYIIKKYLVDAGILECNGSYNVSKGIGKGYRFGQSILSKEVTTTNQTFTSFTPIKAVTGSYLVPHPSNQEVTTTNQTFTSFTPIKDVSTSYLVPHPSKHQYYQAYCLANLSKLKFEPDIDNLISTVAIVKLEDLKLNDDITSEYINISYGNVEYRYRKKTAIKTAKDQDKVLIKYKKEYYIDTIDNFIVTKSYSQRLSNCYNVFNINNQIFYCDRNDTNYRLDHNLTGLKKELFNKLTFDGERLHELDIANAQFAIAAHLNPDIDQSFIQQAQAGTLYSTIEEELKLKPNEGKAMMFKVAFDKVHKTDPEQNIVRNMYPKYMAWVDAYKEKNGYKAFANLLQRKESGIMIDGLLNQLIEGGYNLFTIHDALRVKQSDTNTVYDIAKNYFDQIGFTCYLRKEEDKIKV